MQGRWNLPSPLRAPFGKRADLALTFNLRGEARSSGKVDEEYLKPSRFDALKGTRTGGQV